MIKSEFSGECMVFAKEHNDRTFYSAGLSKKKADGEYENGYIDVVFKKGVSIENKTKIEILKGWLTFYINKEKRTVPQIFISEFEILSENKNKEDGIPEGFQAMEDDDIPWA